MPCCCIIFSIIARCSGGIVFICACIFSRISAIWFAVRSIVALSTTV